jgi:DNA-binding NarL/FixJ family response regulator
MDERVATSSDRRREISILVAHYDEESRLAIQQCLAVGFPSLPVIHTASSGEEVLVFCGERKGGTTIVISSHSTPGINGVELVRKLRQGGHDARTLLCVGGSDDTDFRELRKEGLLGIVHEPLTSESLLWQVAKAL